MEAARHTLLLDGAPIEAEPSFRGGGDGVPRMGARPYDDIGIEGGMIVVLPRPATLSVRSALLVLLLTAVAAPPTQAASPQEEREPRPPVLVTLELSLPDRQPIQVTVADGQLATLEHSEFAVGLVPRVSELTVDDVDIDVVELQAGAGRPAGRLHERIRGRRGFSSFTAAAGKALEVRVVAIGEQPAAASCTKLPSSVGGASSVSGSGPNDSKRLMPVGGGCCLTCDGIRTCGCAVSTACGYCCGCAFCQ